MIKRLIICAALVSVAACGFQQQRPNKSPMQLRIEKIFNTADTDHDEWLTPQELDAGFPWLAGKFADVDTDHNGKVSLAEVTSYIELSRMLPEKKK